MVRVQTCHYRASRPMIVVAFGGAAIATSAIHRALRGRE
jgi:hypothetical protein